jgi:hypothetical protein
MPASDNHLPHPPSIASDPEFLATIQQALIRTTAAIAITPPEQHTALLKKIIDESDVCMGVFNDSESPQGWDRLVIKGERVLKKISRSGLSKELKLAAISCRAREEAIAMKQVFGEKS